MPFMEMNGESLSVKLYPVSKSSTNTSVQNSWDCQKLPKTKNVPQEMEKSVDVKTRKNSSFKFIDKRRKSKFFNLGLFLLLVVCSGVVMTFLLRDNILHLKQNSGNSGGLPFKKGPIVNCTPLAVNEFPKEIFSQTERRSGAIILHCTLAAYTFLALAIVCDDFFVPSLEAISEKLQLNADVAGATFMAIGSSTPELFTSVAGVFITENDIGVGTIVGSAVFNIVFIISLCALLMDTPTTLSWYPVVRDSAFYLLSVVALVCIMLDHYIFWYEAAAMLVLYALYILLMYINDGVSALMESLARSCCPQFCCPVTSQYEDFTPAESSASCSVSAVSLVPLMRCKQGPVSNEGQEGEAETSEKTALLGRGPRFYSLEDSATKTTLPVNELHGDENMQIQHTEETSRNESIIVSKKCKPVSDMESFEHSSPLKYPSGGSVWSKCLWFLSFPIYLVLTFTVPDCRKFDNKLPIVFLSFCLSIVWIGCFSYLMVWMVTVIGFTLSIPDTIMGLTLLAAGTSVPDAMASVIVARNGEADMAVSNSIGSNIFDILFCLGLPWFLKSINEPVPINSAGVIYIGLTVMTTVLLIVGTMLLNKWVLNKKLGVFLLLLYLVFVIYASLVETNTFGYVNPPPCKH